MGRNLTFAPGEFYHVYNRGTEKRNIFSLKADYERFITLLYVGNGTNPVHLQLQGSTLKEALKVDRGEPLVDIGAYCLMPNHFHLLVREREKGGVSRFMQKLLTGYTMYFNKRHQRTGALFQGKFKVVHAGEDTYLKYLLSYIHLNPIKIIDPKWKENGIASRSRAETFLEEYSYSSFTDFLGKERAEKIIINKESLPDYFETQDSFRQTLADWMDLKDNFKVEP